MSLLFSPPPTLHLLQLGIQGRLGKIGTFAPQMKAEHCFYHKPKSKHLPSKKKKKKRELWSVKRQLFMSGTAGWCLLLWLPSKSSPSLCSCPVGPPRGSTDTFVLGAGGWLRGNSTSSLHCNPCEILYLLVCQLGGETWSQIWRWKLKRTSLIHNFHQIPALLLMIFLAASAHFRQNPKCCMRDLVSLRVHHF